MNRDTEKQIDRLLQYLPLFSDHHYQCVISESPWEPDENGVYTFPDVVYQKEVGDFFKILGNPFWFDSSYHQHNVRKILASDELLEQCTFEQLKAVLTYCSRGERFCTGHRRTLIESGKLTRILLRLKRFKDQGSIS